MRRSTPILLVEDDPDLRTSLAEVLREEGFEVWCANNGEEALATLRERSAPSAILLDLAMPVMDGWTFRARQRSDPRLAGIPTVVISASHPPARAGELEADAFLAKPFEVASLIAALERVS